MSKLFPEPLLEELGILDWGYTEESVPVSYERFTRWITEGQHGELAYLADHRKDLRSDVKNLYPSFKSALVFLFSYQPAKKWLREHEAHGVAAYALGFEGEDYHLALKRKLDRLLEHLKETHPQMNGFISLDAQPVLERDLAFRAGLGWFGKNSMLISRGHGSYFIIGSLLLNEKLEQASGQRDTDHCGTCTDCADACPTNAIDVQTRTLRANDCISTYTIEVMKDEPPPKGMENGRGEIFGCDICQDVCPWNRKPLERVSSRLQIDEAFQVVWEFLRLSKSDLRDKIQRLSGRGFLKLMDKTALGRPGRKGWLKNLR